MNPISFFLKKQFEIEDKIQHLLKDIQDMVLRHQNAFEAYLEEDWEKFACFRPFPNNIPRRGPISG